MILLLDRLLMKIYHLLLLSKERFRLMEVVVALTSTAVPQGIAVVNMAIGMSDSANNHDCSYAPLFTCAWCSF